MTSTPLICKKVILIFMVSDTHMHRLFFALWPNNQVRQSIIDLLPAVPVSGNCRITQPEDLHITLHFIGQVTHEVKDCLHHAALSIKNKPFIVNLNCLGDFNKAKICWMGCQDRPVELMLLRDKLGEPLVNCGYQIESRDYKPHVTLMRKCTTPVDSIQDFVIPWFVEEFALIESIPVSRGVSYQVIEKYPLA